MRKIFSNETSILFRKENFNGGLYLMIFEKRKTRLDDTVTWSGVTCRSVNFGHLERSATVNVESRFCFLV